MIVLTVMVNRDRASPALVLSGTATTLNPSSPPLSFKQGADHLFKGAWPSVGATNTHSYMQALDQSYKQGNRQIIPEISCNAVFEFGDSLICVCVCDLLISFKVEGFVSAWYTFISKMQC